MWKSLLMVAVALLMASSPSYAQVAGKWMPDGTQRIGGTPVPRWTLDLKVSDGTLPGSILTGTWTQGRTIRELTDGHVFLGSQFSFTTTREEGRTIQSTGEVVGDELRLKVTGDGGSAVLIYKRVK